MSSEKQIGNVVLNYDCYPNEDLYSDGDAAEEKLVEIARTRKPEEFDRVVAEEKDWAVMYHFSSIRENILSWYPFTGKEKVLEVGSGCGAVTGLLADRTASVDCVELSERRSTVNALRNQDKTGIRILLGNFEDVEKTLSCDYDIITLIGVFEYAVRYIGGNDPYVNFLTLLKKHLSPGGKILVAIENRLGLKYWAGCREDHTGILFDGIEGYAGDAGVRTFSKPEIEALFAKAGFADAVFYYPYPDYKFPFKIFSDAYLPKKGDLGRNMNNYDRERWVLFDESRVFDTLLEDGLFPLYSNSFLAILGEEEKK